MILEERMWTCSNEEETLQLGRSFGRALNRPVVISLEGDLGAGKTRFTQGLAEGLGIDPTRVGSPTFTLVHEYEGGRQPLFHFDWYRLRSEEEIWEMGWSDYRRSGVCVVEWGNRFPQILSHDAVRIVFEIDGERRILRRMEG